MPFSTETLTFGVEDQNDSMIQTIPDQSDETSALFELNQTEANQVAFTPQFRKITASMVLENCPDNDVMVSRPEQFAATTVDQNRITDDLMGMTLLDGDMPLSEITQSTILDPCTIYYVPNPPLFIHSTTGQEIDVVIPSDTIIIIGQDWDNYAIVVYDGANVHFGAPAPSSTAPTIPMYPGDVNNPVPPVWVVSEFEDPFFNNRGGIYIDRTAGKRTRLDNIYIQGFYYGVIVDQQLNSPISNLFLQDCYCGITSFGSNQIANSVVDNFGVGDESWPYWGIAFEFEPTSLDESILFTNPDYGISNCLANGGDVGYWAAGSDESNAPNYIATDSVATNCYYGYACWDVIGISIVCPGLYNNYEDKNYIFDFTEPVYETSNPFVTRGGDYRLFLNPASAFINKGSYLSPAPGWTTRTDGVADSNIGDIWPHYQTTKLDKFTGADLATDYTVNISDIDVFASQWLATGTNSADLNNDGNVDNRDFVILANQWRTNDISLQFIDPNSGQTVSPDAVRGYVGISIKDISLFPKIFFVSACLDNTPIGTLSFDWDQPGQWIDLESQPFLNGWHTLRFATIDIYGNVVNHKPINVKFNNSLYLSDVNEHFITGQDYKISGFHDGPNSVTVTVTDIDSQTIWTNSYSGSYISVSVPAATMNNQLLATMTIASSPGITIDLTKKFNPADCSGVKMVIVMPNKDVFKARKSAIIACAQACENQNLVWVPLYLHDVTSINLTNLYNRTSVKYIYWAGHANSHVGNVRRTHTLCWKDTDRGWWDFIDNWDKIGVFSYINPEYPLPDDWDNRGFDLSSLGMDEQWNKKIIFVDGCLSAKYNDMAEAYGVFSLQGQGSIDQIYIGWTETVDTHPNRIIEFFSGDTTAGVKMFWERMGLNDSVEQAFKYIDDNGSAQTQKSFFFDTIWDRGEDDNIVLLGNGFVRLNELKLVP